MRSFVQNILQTSVYLPIPTREYLDDLIHQYYPLVMPRPVLLKPQYLMRWMILILLFFLTKAFHLLSVISADLEI